MINKQINLCDAIRQRFIIHVNYKYNDPSIFTFHKNKYINKLPLDSDSYMWVYDHQNVDLSIKTFIHHYLKFNILSMVKK